MKRAPIKVGFLSCAKSTEQYGQIVAAADVFLDALEVDLLKVSNLTRRSHAFALISRTKQVASGAGALPNRARGCFGSEPHQVLHAPVCNAHPHREVETCQSFVHVNGEVACTVAQLEKHYAKSSSSEYARPHVVTRSVSTSRPVYDISGASI